MADTKFIYREHMAAIRAPILQLEENLQQPQAFNELCIHLFWCC